VLEINCRFGIKNQAISISDSSMTEDAKLSLILASWGSTNRVAYIDIMSGSITIGTETMQIHILVKRTICPMPTKGLRICSNSESGGGSDSVYIIKLKATLPEANSKSCPVQNLIKRSK
jgi:hypothetical protein